MLVLGRKFNEKILIGNDVVVQVVRMPRGCPNGIVALGIEAPHSVQIMRGELLDRAREEERDLPLDDPEVPPR